MQGIRDLHAAFVADAVARCQEAVSAVEGAHEALVASDEAQAQLLEQTIAAQHAAAQRALMAARDSVTATVRCRTGLPQSLAFIVLTNGIGTCSHTLALVLSEPGAMAGSIPG